MKICNAFTRLGSQRMRSQAAHGKKGSHARLHNRAEFMLDSASMVPCAIFIVGLSCLHPVDLVGTLYQHLRHHYYLQRNTTIHINNRSPSDVHGNWA